MRFIDDNALGIVCVFQEAEGEPYDGKRAVAEVIRRRTVRKYMSDGTVAGTVFRKKQFSGMNHDAPNRIRSFQLDTKDPIANDCSRAWMESEWKKELVPDCLHYFAHNIVTPPWAKDAEVVAIIGGHTFVKGVD